MNISLFVYEPARTVNEYLSMSRELTHSVLKNNEKCPGKRFVIRLGGDEFLICFINMTALISSKRRGLEYWIKSNFTTKKPDIMCKVSIAD